MDMQTSWTTLTALAFLLVVGSTQSRQPEVKVDQGVVRGTIMTSEVDRREFFAFLGIPYAEPPIGPMRFKEAAPGRPWLGILNATNYGPSCVQYSHHTQRTGLEVHGSEDCLYLNVYTPKLPEKGDGLMDVMIYIHGGGFMFYWGGPYGPEYLLDRNIVVVTLSYRLGVIGFLSTEDLVVPGNNGLKDQLIAIKWVKRNIDKFGGNPNRISLSGTSAGGASVHYHTLSPQSKGLFTHGIPMSGTAINPWTQTDNSLEKARRISSELGCPVENTTEMVDCLRNRPAEQIVSKTKMFIPWSNNPFTPFGPVVEPPSPTAFISKKPIDIIRSKEASDIPLLFSYTTEEGLFSGAEIIENEKLLAELESNWNDLLPHVLDYNFTVPESRKKEVADKIKAFYLKKEGNESVAASIIQMIGDRLFTVGVRRSAKLHAELYKSPIHAYIFGFKGPQRGFMALDILDGVSHGDDLAYVFKKKTPWGPIGSDEESKRVSKYLIDTWMNFMNDSLSTSEWPDVKRSLPDLGYMKITGGPESNRFEVDKNTNVENFWRNLGFQED